MWLSFLPSSFLLIFFLFAYLFTYLLISASLSAFNRGGTVG
jgi:hypothetical protein